MTDMELEGLRSRLLLQFLMISKKYFFLCVMKSLIEHIFACLKRDF